MKFKTKLLTAIISICMFAFVLPMAVSAADSDSTSSDKDTITCYVRAEADDGTILPYTKVTMNKNEVPSFSSYAIKNAPDDVDYITPMHILLQAMTDKGMTDELATVDIGSSGWITDMFGWGMDNLWCLDGIDAPVVSAQYEAQDGEKYTFYQAYGNWGAGSGYTGYGFFGEYGEGKYYTPYSAVETDEVTTEVGKDVELTYRYTSSMHTPLYGPCNNEDGAYTMVFVGQDGADRVTDEDYREDIEVDKDGKFKVSFDKPGTYVVSARYYNSDNTRGACNAYCKVTVNLPKEVTETINKIKGIGDVTLESEKAIEEARAAYDALTEDQKKLVSNTDVLEKAESTLKELKDAKEKEDADKAKLAATPKTITLSKTRVIYNGKVQKPAVTVKNAKGEIIPAENYTVNYAAGCKNVGKYKVTLTFKGLYNGTKTKTFKIAPKAATVKSVKAAKKSFEVKWSKQLTQVTGYHVQYSTDKNFEKNVNNKKITKNSIVNKTVKNLKSKKVYYVRVRTYKTVTYNGEQLNLHSDWSTVKKVTVK